MKEIKNESVAVLIPAHNEERVIEDTLKSVLKFILVKDLYMVDDGSDDKTFFIAKKYCRNILRRENHGKANALNAGVKHFNLSNKYDFIFFIDADTQPRKDFIDRVLPHFRVDTKKEIVCVSGRIKGDGKDWISKYRQWEYQISFNIHKTAQAHMSSILVTPGCATVYRSSVIKTHQFPTGTLTEDMDFTFQMHRAGLRNMVFENKAVVYTVDPDNIKDFIKQLNRWYTGFWQVVRKHDIPWQGQSLDLEVAILATEGLYNGLLVIFIFISVISLIFFGDISIFFIPLLIDLFIFFLPSLVWSSISDKDFSRILYIPHFYLLRFISSTIFLTSFFNGFLSEEKEYVWNSSRSIGKEAV